MVTQVKAPQLYLPTGYEGLQQSAAAKRKIADAMWASGMNGNPNKVSIAQVLGDLAQMWAGKSMGKEADKLDLEAKEAMGQDYRMQFAQFSQDAKVLSPADMVAKYGSNPWFQEALKPYEGAMEAGMKEGQQMGFWDGQRWARKDQVAPGSYKANDPNSSVIRGQDGSWQINPVKITASIASQGIPVEQGTYSLPDPALSGQAPANVPQGMQPKSAPNGYPEHLTMEQYQGAVNGLGPAAASSWIKRNGLKVQVSTPQEAESLPSGTIIILPDGSEGEVP